MWLRSLSLLIFCVFLTGVAASVFEDTSDRSKFSLNSYFSREESNVSAYDRVKREKEDTLKKHKEILKKELAKKESDNFNQDENEIIKDFIKKVEGAKSSDQKKKLADKLVETLKSKYQTRLNKLLLQESMLCKINDQADDFDSLDKVRPKLKYGDIIEFKRTGYSHFSVYVDNNQLFQFENLLFDNITVKNILNNFPSMVIFNKIDVTSHGDPVRVNNKMKLNLPFNRKEMDLRIKEAISRNRTDDYHLLVNNCEHFATYIRYGIPFSDQIESILKIAKDVTHSTRLIIKEAFDNFN